MFVWNRKDDFSPLAPHARNVRNSDYLFQSTLDRWKTCIAKLTLFYANQEDISDEGPMGIYQPQTVEELAIIIGSICEALEANRIPVSAELKQRIAVRIVELHESGITDPDPLLREVMADKLWEAKAA